MAAVLPRNYTAVHRRTEMSHLYSCRGPEKVRPLRAHCVCLVAWSSARPGPVYYLWHGCLPPPHLLSNPLSPPPHLLSNPLSPPPPSPHFFAVEKGEVQRSTNVLRPFLVHTLLGHPRPPPPRPRPRPRPPLPWPNPPKRPQTPDRQPPNRPPAPSPPAPEPPRPFPPLQHPLRAHPGEGESEAKIKFVYLKSVSTFPATFCRRKTFLKTGGGRRGWTGPQTAPPTTITKPWPAAARGVAQTLPFLYVQPHRQPRPHLPHDRCAGGESATGIGAPRRRTAGTSPAV